MYYEILFDNSPGLKNTIITLTQWSRKLNEISRNLLVVCSSSTIRPWPSALHSWPLRTHDLTDKQIDQQIHNWVTMIQKDKNGSCEREIDLQFVMDLLLWCLQN